MVDESKVKERYEKCGQDHVFKHLSELSDSEKDIFLKQLDSIEVESLASLLQAAKNITNVVATTPKARDPEVNGEPAKKAAKKGGNSNTTGTPRPFSKHVGRTSNKDDTISSFQVGIEAVRAGEVAALVLAGGQGTRLGFLGPKGMYNINLPSKRSLFHIICERILRLRKLAAKGSDPECQLPSIPFYIMTSQINHEQTVRFFEENEYFGLEKKDVCFFKQGMLPCLTEDGKIILEKAGAVAMAPDGNGGIYPSLVKSGMFSDMEHRKVKYLHVFSIDNALTKPADPVFIGYCMRQGADCGNKVVWKSSAHEKVGVIAEKDGRPCVVEYSDISREMAEAVDSDGRLQFGAGNICNHFYTLEFLKTEIIAGQLVYHIAKKKIPFYDEESKTTVTPATNNGVKLETFIFDVFPLSKNMAVLDVRRCEEFAPVKNAPGSTSDSPDTARTYISELAKQWVKDAGGILVGDQSGICEVSPLTSYGGEGLEELVKGKEISCPFSL